MSEDEAAGAQVLAEEVFGDRAKLWMSRPTRALAGSVPDDLLDSAEGRQAVRNVLGRLAHGVFS